MRMIDCFRDLLAETRKIADGIRAGEMPEFETVRSEVDRRLSSAEACGRDGRFGENHFADAKFAAAAFVDEQLLTAGWPDAGRWQRESIQFREFATNNAGVEFFERLDRLSPVNPADKDVREVYTACLAMGFKGRYYAPGDAAAVANKTQENLKLVVGEELVDGELGDAGLFPGSAIPPSGGSPLRLRRHFRTLSYGLPVLVFIALFYVLRGHIVDAADALVSIL
ncbi:MAG: DotU family type IV/VI secretion system protein [Gammaproteobacteria bacterium]